MNERANWQHELILNALAEAHHIAPEKISHTATIFTTDDGNLFVGGCLHVTDLLLTVFRDVDPEQLSQAAQSDGLTPLSQDEGPRTTWAEALLKSELAVTMEGGGFQIEEMTREILRRLISGEKIPSNPTEDTKPQGGYL